MYEVTVVSRLGDLQYFVFRSISQDINRHSATAKLLFLLLLVVVLLLLVLLFYFYSFYAPGSKDPRG